MGFSQELKDFVAAFQTTSRMGVDAERVRMAREVHDRYNSPEAVEDRQVLRDYRRALAEKARRPEDPEVARGRRVRNDYYEQLMKNGGKKTTDTSVALPIDFDSVSATYDLPDEEEGVGAYSRGGAVKSYARGGVVEEEIPNAGRTYALPVGYGEGDKPFNYTHVFPEGPEKEGPLPVPNKGRQYVQPPAEAEGDRPANIPDYTGPLNENYVPNATRTYADARTGAAPEGMLDYAMSHEAVREGLKFAIEESNKVPTPRARPQQALPLNAQPTQQPSGVRAYMRGAGAADPQQVDEVKRVVDPQRKMSESERNLAALGAVYTHYLQNDPTKAKRAASAILQNYRVASQRYAALAAAAAEGGDLDAATKAALHAYAYIPDGREIRLHQRDGDKISYSYVDSETKKVIEKGVATPQQLAAQALRVSSNGFDEFILAAAGERTAGTAKKAGAPKPADRAKTVEAVDAAWNEHLAMQTPEGGEAPKIDPKEANTLKTSAYHILSSSKQDMTPGEAVAATDALTAVDPKNPKAVNFKVKMGKEGADVQFKNGRTIRIPAEQFRILMALRVARAKRAQEALDGAQESAGRFDRLMEGAGEYVGALKDDLSEAGGAMLENLKRGATPPHMR